MNIDDVADLRDRVRALPPHDWKTDELASRVVQNLRRRRRRRILVGIAAGALVPVCSFLAAAYWPDPAGKGAPLAPPLAHDLAVVQVNSVPWAHCPTQVPHAEQLSERDRAELFGENAPVPGRLVQPKTVEFAVCHFPTLGQATIVSGLSSERFTKWLNSLPRFEEGPCEDVEVTPSIVTAHYDGGGTTVVELDASGCTWATSGFGRRVFDPDVLERWFISLDDELRRADLG